MKQKRIARWVYEYNADHGLPQDDLRNWCWASEFISKWSDEITKARIYESRGKVKAVDRVDEKVLLWIWLDIFKFGYVGTDPIKPEAKWRRVMRWLFSATS